MTTRADINGLALDMGVFKWPLYRGAVARPVMLYGFGPRWPEYKSLVNNLKGAGAKVTLYGTRNAGGNRGGLTATIPEVFVYRATKVNDVQVALECYDSRFLLTQAVGDMDFNMSFGDEILEGTEYVTYKDAIQAYCLRFPFIVTRLAGTAFDSIPDHKLEKNAHLSALVAADPLGYLCERAGCDLVVGLDGKWYFASRADADAAWFANFEDYNWLTRPGFLSLESIVTQKPRTIVPYYWEHHCIRAEGGDPASTVSSYGPEATRIQLSQVYKYDGEYHSLGELCTAFGLGSTFITDAQIARSFWSGSAQGSPLHPCDTAQRKELWEIIRRDWRRLWRIEFPSGSTGGWDQWRFGKLLEDGSIDPVTVECKYVTSRRIINPQPGGTIEGSPWTFNKAAPSPFKAMWDDGPESSVIRIGVDDAGDSKDEVFPPMPGWLTVTRKAGSGLPTDALLIVGKDMLDNGAGETGRSLNCTIFGREDVTIARFVPTFQIIIYLTARRFMPNDKTRWHAGSQVGYADGDIDRVELPPSGEVNCYRTYVGGDAPAAASDGLGAVLNVTELADEDARRAEVWKLTHALSVTGEGRADTLALGMRARVVDGPVEEAVLCLDGVETYTEMSVGNLADNRARRMIADKRVASRRVEVQGNNG